MRYGSSWALARSPGRVRAGRLARDREARTCSVLALICEAGVPGARVSFLSPQLAAPRRDAGAEGPGPALTT
jgi:hypothetical protein